MATVATKKKKQPLQATADVFMLAFRRLPRKERAIIIARIFSEDKEALEELYDGFLVAQRRNEPTRPFREILAELGLQ